MLLVHLLCLMPELIRKRTDHCSDSLFKYGRPSKEKIAEISSVLGPITSANQMKISGERINFDKFRYYYRIIY